VLTKIPFNENLLTIYKFELEKGEISLKNLKNNKFFKKNQHFMPFSIFHLLKNDFTKQIDFYESDKLESLKQYFLNYNIIKKFNENFYMINNFEIQKINLKFDDNRIVDID